MSSFYCEFLNLLLSRCFTNSLAFIIALTAIQTICSSLYPHDFAKYSITFFLLLEVLTIEGALYIIFQMTSYKVQRWPIHLFEIGPQGANRKQFRDENWNVGRILILGGNSNLYLSLNTCSTIRNGAPTLDINLGVRPYGQDLCPPLSASWSNWKYPSHTIQLLCIQSSIKWCSCHLFITLPKQSQILKSP